jgi:hypothetical protein
MFSTWFIPRYYEEDWLIVTARSKTAGVESWWLVAKAGDSWKKKKGNGKSVVDSRY